MGIHLIADLHQCDPSSFASTEVILQQQLDAIAGKISECGFTPLDRASHFFGEHAATAVFCLAESHVAFHSWPEKKYVSLDIFACNNSKDCSAAAEGLLSYLSESVFHAKDVRKKITSRG